MQPPAGNPEYCATDITVADFLDTKCVSDQERPQRTPADAARAHATECRPYQKRWERQVLGHGKRMSLEFVRMAIPVLTLCSLEIHGVPRHSVLLLRN
jgi:hypothetical protein